MKKNKYLPLIIVVIFAGCISLLFLFLTNSNVYTAREEIWQIVAGSKIEFEEGTKFSYGSKGPSYEGASENEYLYTTPLYTVGGNEIIIPEYSVYIDKTLTKYAQIPCYTSVYSENKIQIENIEVDGGFIFDGVNSYTFLDDMVIEINGLEVEAPALSSIMITNDNMYSFYRYDLDEIQVGTNETVSMMAKCGEYSIDLLNDLMYTREEEKILIYNDPDSLDTLW